MAKLYYGDTNNTAVEINLGGGVSGDYLPLNVTEDTTVNMEGNGTLTFSGKPVYFEDGFYIPASAPQCAIDTSVKFGDNIEFIGGNVTFVSHAPISQVAPTNPTDVVNKQYVDSNFPLSPTIRNIQVVSALPSSPDASTLYLIQG